MKLKFPNLSFITANDISGIALKTLDNKIPKTAKFNKTMRKKWGLFGGYCTFHPRMHHTKVVVLKR